MEAILPEHISFEALKFIHEVKTTTPIPWINEFDDTTIVESETQKKLVNELAQVFMLKDRHTQTVIELLKA